MNLTFADVDYLGLADVWFHDFDRGDTFSKTAAAPLGRGMSLPDRVAGGDMRRRTNGFDFAITEETNGTRLRVSSEDLVADVLATRPEGHESMSVVIPWSERRFQYTNKDVARPAAGSVRWKGRTYEMRWATLDFGRGRWPYRTRWNWGAGAGICDGRRIGIQVGGKWTDGTGMTENAVSVDGRISKISEDLVWGYSTRDWLKPWTIRAPRSGRVDLVFTPIYDKVSRLRLGIASSSVDQCFGTYSGTLVPDDGIPIRVSNVFGWAEEASWRW